MHGMEGASRATGLAVVIDVFRAFTTACHAAAAGATRIFPAGSLEEAMQLRDRFPDAVLAGERFGKPLPGCDFGNSPALLEAGRSTLAGRPFIQATHAGTRGLLAARNADLVLAASLANAGATARFILLHQPAVVSLVPMGWAGEEEAEEDNACADYLAALLHGVPFDTTALPGQLRHAKAAEKFFDPAQPWAPEADFDLCLQTDHFPFALRLDHHPGQPAILTPVSPEAVA